MSVQYRPPTEAEMALASQVYDEVCRAEGETGLRVVSVSLNPADVAEDRRATPLTIWAIPVHFDELVPPGQVFVNLKEYRP